MDQLTQALDALEAARTAADGGTLLAAYPRVRPHLIELVSALAARGGDPARVGAVIERLIAGADSVALGPPVVDTFRSPGKATVDDGGDDVATSDRAAAAH